MSELLCVACRKPLNAPRGTIVYYHATCRSRYKSRYQPLIHRELTKKRPWYFWLWLWIKRRFKLI